MSACRLTLLLSTVIVCALGATPSSADDLGRIPGRRESGVRNFIPHPQGARPRFARLPPVEDELPPRLSLAPTHLGRSSDGTFSSNGQDLIVQIDGQEYRLVKSDSQTASDISPARSASGEVHGRLLHRGRPLGNSAVRLVPLTKMWNGYSITRSAAPLLATTDDDGVYHFSNVPAGPYKLGWRPDGQQEWIRRVEMRPDVRVRAGEVAHAKEVRLSLRTIN